MSRPGHLRDGFHPAGVLPLGSGDDDDDCIVCMNPLTPPAHDGFAEYKDDAKVSCDSGFDSGFDSGCAGWSAPRTRDGLTRAKPTRRSCPRSSACRGNRQVCEACEPKLKTCVLCRSPLPYSRPFEDPSIAEGILLVGDCGWALAMAMAMVIACGRRRLSAETGVEDLD